MSDPKRAAALNRARVAKHRVKLRTPVEVEEETKMDANILRRNGYAATDGVIEPCRGGTPELTPYGYGPARFKHTHLGIVRIDVGDSKNSKALIAAAVAAADEPASLVGTGDTGAVLVFRIGDSYAFQARAGYQPPQAQHEFVLDAQAALFTATAEAAPFDVSAYFWANDRSPLNVPHCELPPSHEEIAQAAFDAVNVFLHENGGRLGPLVVPESPVEAAMRRAAERRAGMRRAAPETPEQADERLVAANPDLRQSDGVTGLRVAQARARIAARKEAEREENDRKEAERKKAKLRAALDRGSSAA